MLYCRPQDLCDKRYRSLFVRASGAALIAALMAAAHCSGENRLTAALMSAGSHFFLRLVTQWRESTYRSPVLATGRVVLLQLS